LLKHKDFSFRPFGLVSLNHIQIREVVRRDCLPGRLGGQIARLQRESRQTSKPGSFCEFSCLVSLRLRRGCTPRQSR
jgi:hypothetical protein